MNHDRWCEIAGDVCGWEFINLPFISRALALNPQIHNALWVSFFTARLIHQYPSPISSQNTAISGIEVLIMTIISIKKLILWISISLLFTWLAHLNNLIETYSAIGPIALLNFCDIPQNWYEKIITWPLIIQLISHSKWTKRCSSYRYMVICNSILIKRYNLLNRHWVDLTTYYLVSLLYRMPCITLTIKICPPWSHPENSNIYKKV